MAFYGDVVMGVQGSVHLTLFQNSKVARFPWQPDDTTFLLEQLCRNSVEIPPTSARKVVGYMYTVKTDNYKD